MFLVVATRRADDLGQSAGVLGRATPVGKILHLEDTYRAVQCNSNYVAHAHRMACCFDAPAVHSYVSRGSQHCRGRPGSHNAGVPQPFVDALAVQAVRPTLTALVPRTRGSRTLLAEFDRELRAQKGH